MTLILSKLPAASLGSRPGRRLAFDIYLRLWNPPHHFDYMALIITGSKVFDIFLNQHIFGPNFLRGKFEWDASYFYQKLFKPLLPKLFFTKI